MVRVGAAADTRTRGQRTPQAGAYEPFKQHTFLESPLSFIFPNSEPGF